MLKLYLDENVHSGLARALRNFGCKVTTVEEARMKGLPDEDQFAFAQKSYSVLVTNDVDFCMLGRRQAHAGIIFILPRKRRLGEVIERIIQLTEQLEADGFKNCIFYV